MFSGVEVLSSTSGGLPSLTDTGLLVTSISPLTFGAPASGTNQAGSNGTISSGLGTGNALPSKLLIKTPIFGASGSSAQTALTRQVIAHTTANLITNNTAILFGRMGALAATAVGVIIRYTVEVNDGTNTQVESGTVTMNAVVNNVGAQTLGTPTKAGNVQALSSGTLTVTFTEVTNGSSIDLKITSNSSLTPTTHRAFFEIMNLSGTSDITLF